MSRRQRPPRALSRDRVIDDLTRKYYVQVAAAVDFARLDAIERAIVHEFEALVVEGQLSPVEPQELQAHAATLLAWLMCMLSSDPRRAPASGGSALRKAAVTGPLVN